MRIRNFIIHRASTIKLQLIGEIMKQDVKRTNFIRLMQIYECRLFGVCIYREEHCFNKLKKEILDAIPDSTEESK